MFNVIPMKQLEDGIEGLGIVSNVWSEAAKQGLEVQAEHLSKSSGYVSVWLLGYLMTI